MLKRTIIPVLMLLLIVSCNNQNKSNEQIIVDEPIDARVIKSGEKLFEGINLPHKVFTIDPEKEIKLLAESGTEIIVPAGSFVDKSGNKPKGKIALKYKEIKTPSDIIIENIDMTYDSAGVNYQFQTAGMFDLRAYSGNEELFLKKGKNIQVSYISNKPGDFNLYRYDGKWNYKGVTRADVPLNAQNLVNTKTITLKPVKADLSNDLILDIKTKHSQFPELKNYHKILWKYTGKLTKDEVANILSSDIYNAEITNSGKTGQYLYRFKTKSGDHELPVSPVFSPKAFESAMKDYNRDIAKTRGSIKIKRTVNVSELGLMNYDRIYHRSDAAFVQAEFKVNNNKVQGLPLFHITGEDDVVVRVDNTYKIYYSPALNNKIIAILPGKKVAVISTEEFLKSVNAAQKGQPVNFELKQLETTVNSPDDLNQIISSL